MRLLIVGSLKGQLTTATKIAMDNGASVTHAENNEQAMAVVRGGKGADLLLVDVGLDIRDLVLRLEAEHIHVPIVACGIVSDARAAVAAIHAGAKEYIPLPPDPELIAAVLAAVANDSRDLVYRDEAMARVIKLAQQIAGSDASVMITGESGTGKEVLARHVHARSNRAKRPFISINCAAIPEHLLESELFGHEKGAFTGAIARRIGKFEEASGGTLLLDEISEMDVRLQSKLLRAIQERVIDRVGGARPVPVDIRIIATSNRNLADAVRQGTFREDLLFRLNVVNLKIPPLRERPADILELAQHFIRKYAAANGVPVRPISADARCVLSANRWQGNVRELENTIHRAVLMANGDEIGADAILTPEGDRLDLIRTAPAVAHATLAAEQVTRALVGRTVANVERDLILETLKHCLGNRTHAANILGISIRTLRNKLNEYADDGIAITPAGSGDPRAFVATT
ncbi:sigma-54-dependent transcriptional regulator FlbD [Nitrobacter winogradskyi]|uniref:DNA-binding NtrC family response regulator n=2 Tax=Nitrobacter winogradskyi TaxID=913 RepID=A0ACC6ALF1_NITWI|nr:sigma-54 dependent transcriptional regulator [Nitrobacter winogradskyi]MCP2000698.1 DNA-binding NtrC family response regulator [Nitrobacter winogradskyi]GEC15042.1 sigma-54-dependent Fis family transcriptional regulator [Nitrobacter winogradskyi]